MRIHPILTLTPGAILVMAASVAFAEPPSTPRFPMLNDAETWDRLPCPELPLPAWAKILAPSMPRTTAAMLQLDHVHRAQNPLGPELRGKLRWVAANANGCDYSRAYAEADLRRAGLTDADLAQLAGDRADLPEAERLALDFARKLTLKAYSVTDEEVAALIEHYGADQVVAIVHTLAHANFQDRIFLALGVTVEPDGPFPPLDIDFDLKAKVDTPPRPAWDTIEGIVTDETEIPTDWLERGFGDLQEALDQQQARQSRIPFPEPERFAALPPDMQKRSGRIVWSRVSLGYQPVLTRTWFETMSAFQEEAQLNPVFSNTMFWVVTRSNECFY